MRVRLPARRSTPRPDNILPENGIPVYVPKDIAEQLKQFEAATPADAARIAHHQLAMGADGIKLFTGSIMGHGKITPMPANIARAAVEEAHAAGKPVFAHPSNHVGTDNALAAGVDILAHTIPIEDGFTPDELATMKAQHTALIPTLTLWEVELEKDHAPAAEEQAFVQRGVNELKTYFDQGGTILFGTDVGYTQHYDTTEEYVLMAKSGMKWQDILASLTTNPATTFKAGIRRVNQRRGCRPGGAGRRSRRRRSQLRQGGLHLQSRQADLPEVAAQEGRYSLLLLAWARRGNARHGMPYFARI